MIELASGLWVVSGEQLTHPWDASAYLLSGSEPTQIDRGSSQGYPALTFGHCPPKIWYDAKDRVREARQQFGVYYSPWFKPFHLISCTERNVAVAQTLVGTDLRVRPGPIAERVGNCDDAGIRYRADTEVRPYTRSFRCVGELSMEI